jgi:hypothetical protein
MGAPSPDISFDDLRRLAITVATRTKHGPNGSGRSGPCDVDCVKCLAERWAAGERGIDKLFDNEIAAANASADAKEAAIAAHGYGDKAPVSPEQFFGLAEFAAPTRLRIECYVRAQLSIGYDVDDPKHPLLDGPTFGYLELGLHYEADEKPSAFRARLLELAEEACNSVMSDRYDADLAAWIARAERPVVLDEDIADVLTRYLDARIVAAFGDRPRFIEVWRRGTDDDEPLTQVYAPHGMPRWR